MGILSFIRTSFPHVRLKSRFLKTQQLTPFHESLLWMLAQITGSC
jgi:hypothetical protein